MVEKRATTSNGTTLMLVDNERLGIAGGWTVYSLQNAKVKAMVGCGLDYDMACQVFDQEIKNADLDSNRAEEEENGADLAAYRYHHKYIEPDPIFDGLKEDEK